MVGHQVGEDGEVGSYGGTFWDSGNSFGLHLVTGGKLCGGKVRVSQLGQGLVGQDS